MNNEKTLREKSMEWWDEVTESEAAVYRMQYFKTRESLTDEQVDFVYQSEHPATIKDKFQSFDGTNDHFAERETISQQTNSVVSIEDAANSHAKLVWGVYVDDVDKDANDTRGGLSKKDFKAGANWQKEQYNSLLNSYRELLQCIEEIKGECDGHGVINQTWLLNKCQSALNNGDNILSKFNQ